MYTSPQANHSTCSYMFHRNESMSLLDNFRFHHVSPLRAALNGGRPILVILQGHFAKDRPVSTSPSHQVMGTLTHFSCRPCRNYIKLLGMPRNAPHFMAISGRFSSIYINFRLQIEPVDSVDQLDHQITEA